MKPGYYEADVNDRRVAVVPLECWTNHEPVPGTDEMVAVDWIRWARVGSNGATTEEKVPRLQKGNSPVWQALKPFYERWREGVTAPIDGTALEAWPGVSRSQIAHLHTLNIRSVEDLAGLNDAAMDRIGMGSRALVQRARDYLEAKKDGTAALAAAKAAVEEQNRMLSERVAELEARVRELAAAKRGRKERDDDGG